MTSSQRLTQILKLLFKNYGDKSCALHFKNPFELLCATILSAQCTDERVNQVTPALFKAYPTAQAMAKAETAAVEQLIHATGFFRNKTKSLINASQHLCQYHKGQVPKTMAELLVLPGVARKTANVVLGTAYGIAVGIVVDTHVRRLSQRLGFSNHHDVLKIEADLMTLVPQKQWINFSHWLIHHGRILCKAQKPLCDACPFAKLCPAFTDKALTKKQTKTSLCG